MEATKHNPSDGVHPLLQPVVLGDIFEYLSDDMGSLLCCRRVHPDWTNTIIATKPASFPLSIKAPRPVENVFYSSSNASALQELLSSPYCTLTPENLTIGKGLEFNNVAILSFIENYGIHLRRLEIQERVATLSILIALKNCPNLRHLEINPMGIKNTDIPRSYQETWNNSLPQLKSLTLHITSRDYFKWRDDYGLVGRNGATVADLGLEVPFDFVILLFTKIPSIKTFKVKNYGLPLWEKLVPRLTQEPQIVQQLDNVHWNFKLLENLNLVNIWVPELRVKVLEVAEYWGNFHAEFSALLESVSGTLQVLKIQKEMDRRHWVPYRRMWMNDRRTVQVTFRTEMKELKKIQAYSRDFALVGCSGPGNSSVFHQLPKLRSFKTLEGDDFDHVFKLIVEGEAWSKMLPVSQPVNFIHGELREFCVDWALPDEDSLLEIKRCFPQLRTLGLTVKGNMLRSVAVELKDSLIQELEINYGESKEGIDQFGSAISGLSIVDCKRYGSGKKKDASIEKVRASFSEWKSLRTLKIRYIVSADHYEDDGGFVPMNNLCVKHGFATMRQLQRITLKGFEIHPVQVAAILNQVPLLSLDLAESKVNDWGWKGTPESLREANEGAIQGIRAKFPCVGLRVANL